MLSQAQEPLQKIKCSSIELLEVMLEETDKRSPILAEWVNSHLELTNFLEAMYELWIAFCSLLHPSYKENLGRSIFRAYHVLRRIADYKGIQVNDLGKSYAFNNFKLFEFMTLLKL